MPLWKSDMPVTGCFRQPNPDVIRYSSIGRLMLSLDAMGLGAAGADAWNVVSTRGTGTAGLGITG
ncbi:hypothetical protein ACS126_06425 [Sphingobacterium lactis]|uniref:hypothetical protein n=1 Tax=Sphingobacterium lactis TaxID=797291 RepID=UPI003EC6DE11